MFTSDDSTTGPSPAFLSEALRDLGVDQLALIVFDACLPPGGVDIGVGSPYGSAGRDFFTFAAEQGFNAMQFGPQGWLSEVNASPYDGASFSRNPLSLSWDLADGWDELAPSREEIDAAHELGAAVEPRLQPAARSCSPSHAAAHRTATALERRVHSRYRERDAAGTLSPSLQAEFDAFREHNADWLRPDALFIALTERYGGQDFEHWSDARDRDLFSRARPGCGPQGLRLTLEGERAAHLASLEARFAAELERHALVQFLHARQHTALLRWAQGQGVELYGDLQAGTSRLDCWHYGSLFLPGYRMGAPPSRTNPEGQPWGYPVLHPFLLWDDAGAPGPAQALVRARAERMFSSYDRVRIDHPHALVCPWVYRGDEEPAAAVRQGARLFSTPIDPAHPTLHEFSLVTARDLDPSVAPYADGRIRRLSPETIARFSRLLDSVMELAGPRGSKRLLCEVLSTEPAELRAARNRHGLGAFRVTQKADVRNPADTYLSVNARPEDWILMGNHDTPTIWGAMERWQRDGSLADRCDYLAARLTPGGSGSEALARRLREEPGELATAQLADALASPARHVLVSFGDLLGLAQPYNVPGEVDGGNWSQRIAPGFRSQHARAVVDGRALSVPRALELALNACGIARG